MALSISSQIQGWRRVPGASRRSKSEIPVKIRLRCDIAIREEVGLGHLKVKGKLHDKGDIPFETAGILVPPLTENFACTTTRSKPCISK
jgi:hypothetical protein